MDAEFVRGMLRRACRDEGGQKAWAAKHGVSAQYVCDVLQGRREPGDGICIGLGIRRVVTYNYDRERAEALETTN